MRISKNWEQSLILANSNTAVTDAVFKQLLDNCFAALTGFPEPHNMNNLYGSKPDIIKELYAALLSVSADFVRNGQTRENVIESLGNQCNYSVAKTSLFGELYEKKRGEIEACLVNIGSHLPHITDVTWKIDYIIKSSNLDVAGGPLFRICLQTEKFDHTVGGKKIEYVNFTCDTQELQDLVYKLKDAVRHCQRIGSEH